jgi:galactitol-specific phosphotransferase system IIB component
METSLFIETDISKDVEQIAKQREVPIETIYIIAIKEFVQNHKNDDILTSLNKIYSETNSKLEENFEFAQSLAVNEDW